MYICKVYLRIIVMDKQLINTVNIQKFCNFAKCVPQNAKYIWRITLKSEAYRKVKASFSGGPQY